MCRNIEQLRRAYEKPAEEEFQAAALQYVRKVSGFQKPSKQNQEIFDLAVQEITISTKKLIDNLKTRKINK
jgi:hypothetical protein